MSPGHKEGGGGTQPAESRDEGARHTESSQSKGGGSTGGGKAGKVPEAANTKAADREKRAAKEGSKGKSFPTHEKSSTAEKLSAGESVSKRLEKPKEKQKPEWRRQEDQRTKEREQRAHQQEGTGPSPGVQRDWSKKPPAIGKPLSADSVSRRLTAKQYAGAREKGTPVSSFLKASAVSRQDRALPATEALRQDKIWEKSHALTGKEFQEFVGKKMDSLSPGDRRDAALDLARSLTPGDLNSREMATEHGEKALGIIKDELSAKSVKDALKTLRDNTPGPLGPLVALSDIYKGIAEWRDNRILEKATQKDAAAFNKEVKRIDDAIKNIHRELHPRQDATAARRQFTDNFSKFAAEIKASIEAKGQYKVADVYHKTWGGKSNSEEIRAKLTETKRIENPKTGRISELTRTKDVCLGGVDFTRKNTFINPATIETHGTAGGSYPELVLADLLFALSVGPIAAKGVYAIGKDLAGKAAIRAGDSLAAAAAGELRHGGGAIAKQLGGALERQAAKNTSKEAFAKTISLEKGAAKRGVDAFARTEQASVRGTRTFPAAERPATAGKPPEKTLPPLEDAPTGRTLRGLGPAERPPAGRPPAGRPPAGETPPLERPPGGGPPAGRPPVGGQSLDKRPSPEASKPEKKVEVSPSLLAGDLAPKADFFATFKELQPSTIGYDKYLGPEIISGLERLGMDQPAVWEYLDRRIYAAQVAQHSANPALIQSNIRAIVGEHIAKLQSIGAPSEVKKAIQLGLNPETLAKGIDTLKAQGYSTSEIGLHLKRQNQFMQHCRDEFLGASKATEFRRAMERFNSPRDALEHLSETKAMQSYFRQNPGKSVSIERLSQWSNEAKSRVNEIWRQHMKDFAGTPRIAPSVSATERGRLTPSGKATTPGQMEAPQVPQPPERPPTSGPSVDKTLPPLGTPPASEPPPLRPGGEPPGFLGTRTEPPEGWVGPPKEPAGWKGRGLGIGKDTAERLASRPESSLDVAAGKAAAKNRSPEAFAKTQEAGPRGTKTFPAVERPPAGRQAGDKTLPPLEGAPTGRTLRGVGPPERPPAGRPPSGETPPPERPPGGGPPAGRPPGGETPTLPPLDVPRTAAHARERLAQYGFDSRDVQDWENRIRASGVSEAEVGRQMNNNADLMDYYVRFCHDGDTSNLPKLIRTLEDMYSGGPAESIEKAISTKVWWDKVGQYSNTQWEYMNRYHQGAVPSAVKRQFSEEADRFARNKVNEFLNRP